MVIKVKFSYPFVTLPFKVYYYYCLLFAVTHAPFHVSSAEAYSWPIARDRRDREVN